MLEVSSEPITVPAQSDTHLVMEDRNERGQNEESAHNRSPPPPPVPGLNVAPAALRLDRIALVRQASMTNEREQRHDFDWRGRHEIFEHASNEVPGFLRRLDRLRNNNSDDGGSGANWRSNVGVSGISNGYGGGSGGSNGGGGGGGDVAVEVKQAPHAMAEEDRAKVEQASSALFAAITRRSERRVRAAIGSGADVNYRNRDLIPCLHQCVRKDFIPGLKILLDYLADVYAVTPDGWTALLEAAASGRIECATLLLEAGADPHQVGKDVNGDQSLKTAEELARERGHLQMAVILRHACSDSSTVSYSGKSIHSLSASTESLFSAVTSKSLVQMEDAIAFGADVNHVGSKGVCCLLQAVYKNFVPGVKLLIENGADVNLASPTGWTPLVQAAYSDAIECARLLLAADADTSQQGKDSDGTYKTPLEFARNMRNDELADLIETTVAEKSTVRKASKALFAAVLSKSVGDMSNALSDGADVNFVYESNLNGVSCLLEAVRNNFIAGARLLIASSADVNYASKSGLTPLAQAALNGRRECARLLLIAGADTTSTVLDDSGTAHQTPLELARIHRHLGVAELIQTTTEARAGERAASSGALFEAVLAKSTERMVVAIDNGADVDWIASKNVASRLENHKCAGGCSCLFAAVFCQFPDGIRILLEFGASVNHTDSCGWTALMYAAHIGDLECAKVLVAAGTLTDIVAPDMTADIGDEVNEFGGNRGGGIIVSANAYDIAQQRGFLEIANLIRHDSEEDPDSVEFLSRDPAINKLLYEAVDARSMPAVEEAVKLGADVNWTNPGTRNKICPLLEAVYKDFPEAVEYLLDHGASVDTSNPTGWTALVQAGYSGRKACALLLLAAGADFEARGLDKDGSYKTASQFAKSQEHIEVSELIDLAATASSHNEIKQILKGESNKKAIIIKGKNGGLAPVLHPGTCCSECNQSPILGPCYHRGSLWNTIDNNALCTGVHHFQSICESDFSKLPEAEQKLFFVTLQPGTTPVDYGKITSEDLLVTDRDIRTAVSKLPRILVCNMVVSTVRLIDCAVTDREAVELFRSLRNNHRLEVLDLSKNSIATKGALEAWTLLRSHRKLMTLLLSSNLIGDRGTETLASVLLENCTIVEIDLNSNPISSQRKRELRQAAAYNSTLLNLHLGSPEANAAMFVAIEERSIHKLQSAIDKGADIDWTNPSTKNKICALLKAVYKNFPLGVKILLDHGACVDNANPTGWTPLVQAGYSGRVECVRLLLAADADTERKGLDNDGTKKTAIEFARKQHFDDVVKLLADAVGDRSNDCINRILASDYNLSKIEIVGPEPGVHIATCQRCGVSPIVGARYWSTDEREEWDLCETDFCELSSSDKMQYSVQLKPGDALLEYGHALEDCIKLSTWSISELQNRVNNALTTDGAMLEVPPGDYFFENSSLVIGNANGFDLRPAPQSNMDSQKSADVRLWFSAGNGIIINGRNVRISGAIKVGDISGAHVQGNAFAKSLERNSAIKLLPKYLKNLDLTQLTTLRLSYCTVCDEDITAIANSLTGHRALTMLDLSHNNIGSAGADALWNVLRSDTIPISNMTMRNNKICDKTEQALLDAIFHNTTLENLDLAENPFSQHSIKRLRMAMSSKQSPCSICLGFEGPSRDLYEMGIKKRSVTAIKRALAAGADVDWQNPKESMHTALAKAASRGFLEGVKILLDNGASTTKVNKAGNTALILAVSCYPSVDTDLDDVLQCVQLLLEWGSDPHFENAHGHSAIDLSATSPTLIQQALADAQNAAVCLARLENKEQLDDITVYGSLINMYAPARNVFVMTPVLQSLTTFKTLSRLRIVGCGLSSLDAILLIDCLAQHVADTISEIALPRNNIDHTVVRSMLNHCGTSIDGESSSNVLNVWLNLAILDLGGNILGDQGLVHTAYLAEICPSLATIILTDNSIGSTGAIAFGKAMKYSQSVKKVYLGGNNLSGSELMQLRETLSQSGIVRLDLGNFASTKELYSAVSSSSVSRLVSAIEDGADLNWINPDTPNRISALLQAVYKNFVEGVRLLIHHGANINKSNPTGWTPLIQAVYSDRKECARLLLAAGAEIEHKGADNDNTYKTAYEFAVSLSGRHEMRSILEEGMAERAKKCLDTIMSLKPLPKIDITGPIPAIHPKVNCEKCGTQGIKGPRFLVNKNQNYCERHFLELDWPLEDALWWSTPLAGEVPATEARFGPTYTLKEFLSRLQPAIDQLPTYIQTLTNISTLRLVHCGLTDDDAFRLLVELCDVAVREIDLSNNQISNRSAQAAWKLLETDSRSYSSLTHIALSHNLINDDGILGEVELDHILRKSRIVKELYLCGNPVSSQALRRLRIAIIKHPSVTTLQLGMPGASRELYERGAKVKSLEGINRALAKGADPDWRNPKDLKNTSLLKAASFGFVDGVRKLLDAGASPNIVNDNGLTALHRAISYCDTHKPKTHSSLIEAIGCVAAILEFACDPTVETPEGLSAAEIAANPTVRQMIADAEDARVGLDALTNFGVMQSVVMYGRILRKKSSNIELHEVLDQTALYFKECQHAHGVKRLRMIDFNLKARDVALKFEGMMKEINNSGAKLTEISLPRNCIGDQAMLSVAEYFRNNLLLHTVDLSGNDFGDEGLIYIASAISSTKIKHLILNSTNVGDVGADALGRGLKGNIYLNELRMEMNNMTSEGMMQLRRVLKTYSSVTAMTFGVPEATRQLYKAVDEGSMPKMAIAIKSGADIDWTNQDTTNKICALLQAVFKNFTDGVRLLLESGAFVDNYNPTGWTPLVQAGYSGRPECAQLLLDAGADTEPKGMDSDGTYKSALEFARKRNKHEVVRLLERTTAERTEQCINTILAELRDNEKLPENYIHDRVTVTMPLPALHSAISCDACGISPIVGTRYHKLCDNYNLCHHDFYQLDYEEQKLYEVFEQPGHEPHNYNNYIEDKNHSFENLIAKDERICQLINALPTYLTIHPNISILRLTYCRLTDEDADQVLTCLARGTFKPLIEIDLSNNSIGNHGAKLAWSLLNSLQSLLTMNLSNNEISDQGVLGSQGLVESLNNNNTLRKFYFGGNPVSPSTIRNLRQALEQHPSLRDVQLGVPGASRDLYDKGAKGKSLREMDKALRKGANPDWQNPKEDLCSALMKAAHQGFVDGVIHLLKNGASLDLLSRTGETAVMLAARGDLKAPPSSGLDLTAVIETLLEWGCDTKGLIDENGIIIKGETKISIPYQLTQLASDVLHSMPDLQNHVPVCNIVAIGPHIRNGRIQGIGMDDVLPIILSFLESAEPTTNYRLRLVDISLSVLELSSIFNLLIKRGIYLVEFRIPRNKIGDDCIMPIVQFIEQCPTIRIIDMSGNHLSDHGIIPLISAIDKNPALEILNLNDNLLTEASVDRFRDASWSFTNIKELFIARNCFPGDGIRRLMKLRHLHMRVELGTFSASKELYKAVDAKSLQRMKFAIADGADLDWTNCETTNSICSLLEAVFKDFPNGAHLLLKHGAAVDNANPTGWTPLVQAGYSGRFECAKLLLRWGADTEPKGVDSDRSRKSALEFAIKRNNREVADLLRSTIAERYRKKFKKKILKASTTLLLVIRRKVTTINGCREIGDVPSLPVELWDLIVRISMSHLESPNSGSEGLGLVSDISLDDHIDETVNGFPNHWMHVQNVRYVQPIEAAVDVDPINEEGEGEQARGGSQDSPSNEKLRD